MKKLVFLFVFGFFAAFNAMSQCTPDEGCLDIEDPGQICPMVFDSGYVNVPYEQVITFIPPATYNYSGMDLTVQKIVINSVSGLPDGLDWDTNAEEFIPTNPITRYCGVIFGTPTTEGEYPFQFAATVTVLLGSFPVEVPVTQETLGYEAKVVIRPENQAPPVADFTSSSTTANGGEPIQFTDMSFNATAWAWTFEGAVQENTNEQNPTATWNTEGMFDVTLTITNGNCTPPKFDTYIAQDYISISTSIFTNAEFSKICTIYPNPSTGIVNIEGAEISSVEVFNSIGQQVFKSEPNSSKTQLDLSHLQKGAYVVSVKTTKGNARTGISLK